MYIGVCYWKYGHSQALYSICHDTEYKQWLKIRCATLQGMEFS